LSPIKFKFMKQNLFLPKTALAVLMVTFSTWGSAQVLLTEDFNYTIGSSLTSNGWNDHSSGQNSIDVTTGLSFAGYSGSGVGGAANIDNTGEDVSRTFTSQSSGFVYVAFMLQTGSTNNANYFLHLSTNPVNTNNFSARLFVNANGTGIGLSDSGTAPNPLVTIVPNITYLVVIKRNVTTGATNLFVLDSLPTAEPQTANQSYTGSTPTAIGAIALRQYSASQKQIVDGIRVAKTWNDIFPVVSNPTWNGTSWDNGTPTASTPAIINANYTAGSFTAQSVTVNSGFTLNINANQTVTTGNITNNGAIVVNDNGNLIQTGTTSTYTAGTNATFTLNKAYATNVAGKYAFWSSPVQNQNMFTAFTTQPTDVTTYNTSTNYYDAVSNFTNNSGKGYSILMPVGGSAVFTGAPNNGTVNVGLSNSSFGYNLVGNPYPSNLSLTSFLSANNGNISPTLYFWDNTSAPVANQTGQTSSNYGYATFNANGSGTWNSAQSITNGTGNNIDLTNAPALINPSQAFIVKSINGTDLIFNNDMRNSAAATFVNKNGSNSSEGKYWLRLKTPLSANNTLAVTYGEGAINALDGFDSKAIALGSDAFYSKVLDDKLAIQGRTDFVNTDVVPLGSKHFTDGLHTISLANKTGIFNNGQAIYLHDKVLGTYTNLQNTSYNFTVNAGETADRFEVVYLLGTLSTSEAQKGSFEIYRDGNDFYARNNKTIDSIEVFDASGRKVQQINSASQLVRIPLDSKGFYIIKAKSAGKEYSKKITY